jgi:5-methylcytosine-specific restriction endonuclease McrA
VSWEEAVSKIYDNKYEVIAEYAETVSSPSITMNVPAVVRSKKATPRMKKAVKFSRINVYTRDGFRCQYCGVKKPVDELNYDHVVPRSRGGPTNFLNLTTSCYPCNTRKGNRTPAEAGMKLRSLPYFPKSLPLHTLQLRNKEIVPEWVEYIQVA